MVALAALPHANVSAQDALRDSLAGESAAALKRYARENQPYNLKLGDLKLLVDASLQVEANDNVNLVHSGAQADVILRPKISVAGTWPVTPLNSLDLSVGLGYAKYLEHGQYDQLLIQPGSALAFDFFAGDWRINLHDRFSYSQDPLQNGSVSGTAQYGGLNNALGFSADWDLRDVVLTVGFDHLNFISSTKRYSYVDHRAEQALGRASIQLHPAVKAGLEASGGPTDYAQPILSDNLNYSVGPFVGWQVDAHLNLELRGGFVGYTFVPNSGLQNLPDSSSYYFLLQLQHTPSETISHTLEAGRELSSGINANLIATCASDRRQRSPERTRSSTNVRHGRRGNAACP